MSMDLDKDYTVNGHTFKAGKSVDTNASETDDSGKVTKVDYGTAIKDMQAAEKEAADFGGHTSGVPTTNDPLEPTSGTPTRPDGNGNDNKVAGDK